MPLALKEFAASETLYAFNFNEVGVVHDMPQHEGYHHLIHWSVPAIWTKTVRGVPSLALGTLHETFRDDQHPLITPDLFLAEIDSRYGGTAKVKWDGTYVYAPKMPFTQIQEHVAELDAWLEALPAVPFGFTGWCGRP